MKHRKILPCLSAIILMTALMTGCACKHETWNDATCKEPKTCKLCGKNEGSMLGHTTTRGKCSNCNAYVFDDAFIPDYDNFTSCLGVDMIPSNFSYVDMSETSYGFDVRLSISDNKRMADCENLGWDIMLGYTGTADFHILETFSMNYVPENQADLSDLYQALRDELEARLGQPDSGTDTWKESTGTLKLFIAKLHNGVSINIQGTY